jgi:hypothetical protein
VSDSDEARAPAGQRVPADRLSFSFSRIEIAYRPQRPDGTFGPPVSAGWNVTATARHSFGQRRRAAAGPARMNVVLTAQIA